MLSETLKTPVAIVFLVFILFFSAGCKKEEFVSKKVDYVLYQSGNLRFDFLYSGDEVREIVYTYSTNVIERYLFENGLCVKEILQNGHVIDYIRNDSLITAVANWRPDEKYKEYFVNKEGKIYKKIDYTENYNPVTTTYKYEHNNIIEEVRESLTGNHTYIYSYDEHPNPYYLAPIFEKSSMFSANNVLTGNGEQLASYQYDKQGNVIEAIVMPAVKYRFFYK